jgi:hypothetical protein
MDTDPAFSNVYNDGYDGDFFGSTGFLDPGSICDPVQPRTRAVLLMYRGDVL